MDKLYDRYDEYIKHFDTVVSKVIELKLYNELFNTSNLSPTSNSYDLLYFVYLLLIEDVEIKEVLRLLRNELICDSDIIYISSFINKIKTHSLYVSVSSSSNILVQGYYYNTEPVTKNNPDIIQSDTINISDSGIEIAD